MKICFFVMLLFISALICACKHNANSTSSSKKEKELTNTLNAIGKEWIDTLFDENGKVEQIRRGKNNSGKYLDGRCETYYPTGVLKSIKFFYNDTAKGNFLEFYPNGKLSKFNYLIENSQSVYYKEYDTNGRFISEKGNPFVGYDIKETSSLDTAHIQIFLSDFGFTDLNLFVAPDGEKYVEIKSKNGIIEGTKVFKMWKHTKGLNHISVYMKVIGIDSNSRRHVYIDTLSFKR
jgi:MORN repeat variant